MKSHRKSGLQVALAILLGLLLAMVAQPAVAVPPAPGAAFDDFEDGDASDWFFFGGNAAGGGGGPLGDRPREGTYYLSTGWGGNGSASAFYGGFVKNLDNSAQIVLPPDPWLNVWVLNQSNATVDAYTLELTLREDTDGNGWSDGSEDSIGLDTTFTRADFDDQWQLLSAPLSSWVPRGAPVDGVFSGKVDELVVVIGGVQGAVGSTVEVDFDRFAFTSGAPAVIETVVFDDMEHGDPFNNGWFAFPGTVGGGGIAANADDLPPATTGAFSLESGWGSGGTPGYFGGFGRANPSDLSGTDHFNFWINPDAGQEYTLEINLQEDDDGDDAATPADDDEFQFNCLVGAAGSCATAGGGWQLVSIPLADFADDNSYFTGGNGLLDPTPTVNGGNGALINVVITIISSGADATFRTDDWVFTSGPYEPNTRRVIADFENGLASGTDANGLLLGFFTFAGSGSSITIANPATPPAPELPVVGTPNYVLQADIDSTSYAGFIEVFSNPAVDTWVTQDWSGSEGLALWLYGTGSGTSLFIDILDNRTPGSATDTAERFTVTFRDDFTGWQYLEFPFSRFVRKDIGNGAPNDGLGLIAMHGWAFGTLGTGGARTYFMDEVSLYGIATPPALAVNFARADNPIAEGTTGQVAVKLNRPIGADDPDQVSINFATERSNAIAGAEFTPTSGTLTFVRGGASELSFPITTFDDTKFEGNEQIILRLTNPVDVARGPLFQASAFIADNDPFNPLLLDDFEQGAFLWESAGPVHFDVERRQSSETDARPGQDTFENVLVAGVPLSVQISVGGAVCNSGNGVIPVSLLSTPTFDATTVDHRTVTLGNAYEVHRDRTSGAAQRHVADVNGDGRNDLVFHFRFTETGLACNPESLPFNGRTYDGQPITAGGSEASLSRDFPAGQDWSDVESLSFWYEGSGGGEEIVVTLKDNRAPDPGPDGWQLVWSDEFDGPAGAPPNPAHWAYEIGDVTPDGKNGWGNEELQYYTDDPANAATDGAGNLVITLAEADGAQECYYGPCAFTSARLLTQNKAEFAYGRFESRLLVPNGGDGLWPAFWSLGTDITRTPWPAAGEIDFMEYVSRLPNEIFGTIHGPGYSGGNSFGGVWDFGAAVSSSYHTITVEWEPGLISWYVDGNLFHQADPSDVNGPWVFEKPFFLLLNFAVGGNFGGPVGPDTLFPQEYKVDYVRVYQGPDTAERFEARFTDNVAGWQRVTIPVTDFVRSASQPAGAPDDGLGLREVWGYGFATPEGTATGTFGLDLARLVLVPPPSALTVRTLADAGAGSLREAMALIGENGTITFDPSLAGGTITLSTGELVARRSMTIDASAAPGIILSGAGASRVLQVEAGATVDLNDVAIEDGVAAPQGGGVINFGTLNLNRVLVRNNRENSPGPANWQYGGGGIYNGEGATLNLTDSMVLNNTSDFQPAGGIYGFFESTINIVRSTVSGNSAASDVAGGLRSLGNATVLNSTFSGNESKVWHGGAIFHTNGQLTVTNSTFSGNIAPAGNASAILVADFGAPASATLTNNILEGAGGAVACATEGGGATITSGGSNVIGDGSCSPNGTTDRSNTPGSLAPLADNGGPTLTHALMAGSAALDAADAAACPETDQRGVVRPQGAGCDAGSFELQVAAAAGSGETALSVVDTTASSRIFLPAVQR